MIRGYAIAAMAINHFGLGQSYLHNLSGRSAFLISAAEVFLFISGFTLGYITIGRTPEQATTRLAKRTWTVYLAAVGISLSLGTVAMTTDLELWGGLEAEAFEGVGAWIGQVLSMQTAFNGADILITYVIYLTTAIGALRLMTAGRSRLVATATLSVYLLSQLIGSDNLALGFASFRSVAANAPLFFGGLLMGFHRELIARAWRALPARRVLDAVVVGASLVLGWLHVRGWELLTELGEQITGSELGDVLGVREFDMPVLSLLVVFLYLRAAWIVVDQLWVPLHRLLGWLLLPLGEASLFAFTAHLFAIPVIVNLPWWPGEDIGRFSASFWVALYLGLIFAATKVRGRALTWLRGDQASRAVVRRQGPIIVVASLLVVATIAGANPAGASGIWDTSDWDDDIEFNEDVDDDFAFEDDD